MKALDNQAHRGFMIRRGDFFHGTGRFTGELEFQRCIGAETIDQTHGELAIVLGSGRIGAGLDQLKLNRRAAAIEHQDIHEMILRETRQKSTCGAFHAVNSACLSPNLNFAGAIEMPAAAELRAESPMVLR